MRTSNQNDKLGKAGISARWLSERVYELWRARGLPNLRAHDCKHYRATAAIRNGMSIKTLQTTGGWNSPAMPLRCAEENLVMNEVICAL